MITKHKVLIIKLGHSETLDPIISKECSLGDVVRTTVILNYFNEGDSITWLVDEKAEPLLLGNPRLKRVMRWSLENYVQLKNELFDVVINLEKHPGICAFADELKARQKYGFYFGIWSGKAEAHFHTEKVLEIVEVPSIREKNKQYWQEHLARVINKRWSIKDRYIMIEPTKSKGEGIIGLNHEVGSKWPTKGWESWNLSLVTKLLGRLALIILALIWIGWHLVTALLLAILWACILLLLTAKELLVYLVQVLHRKFIYMGRGQ
jgi:heptosyltransferase-2